MGKIKIQRTKLSKHPLSMQPKCLVNIWIRCWRSTNSGPARASGSLEAVAESSPRCQGPFVRTWGHHKSHHLLRIRFLFPTSPPQLPHAFQPLIHGLFSWCSGSLSTLGDNSCLPSHPENCGPQDTQSCLIFRGSHSIKEQEKAWLQNRNNYDAIK